MESGSLSDGSQSRNNVVWWILSRILAPLSIPFILLKLWHRFQTNQRKYSLSSKVVLITGASSGLGEALAHVFFRAGCKVVLAARREEELNRVRDDLLASGKTGESHEPIVLPLDLCDLKSISTKITDLLSNLGGIDILINNGGISVRADVQSTAFDVDVKVMTTNYFGTVALTKSILPSMILRKQGKIVFISSVQGKFSIPYRSAYAASKHAIQAFADSLRAEVANDHIEVLCVSPGYIKTSLSMNALTGSGEKYGVMDSSTEEGYSTDEMASKILQAVLRRDKDIIIAQPTARLAYYLRFLCPSLYFLVMERRALKSKSAA